MVSSDPPADRELRLPPVSQRVVPVFEAIAKATGHVIAGDILDFGAGAGRHVAEFRAAGFEALGVDQSHTSHEDGAAPAEFLRRTAPPTTSFRLTTIPLTSSTRPRSWST